MFYTNNLLRKYLTLTISAEDLAKELTMKSCEVEKVRQRTIPQEVVIWLVKSVVPHPNADKLVICQLDCGDKWSPQICTGATNIIAGNYVPVAMVWCHLPAINLSIAPRPMRGEDSMGMICSKEELGIALDLDKHWIWTLQGEHHRHDKGHDEDWTAGDFTDLTEKDCGTPLGEKFPWLDNWIIDVENKTITHRPDMFGHFGLATELATLVPDAVTFQTLSLLREKQTQGHVFQMLSHAEECGIGINVTCPEVYAYTILQLNDITVKKSSLYTQLTLADMGQQSKLNWVDFSNLFMLTTGQPVHFFDTQKIEGDIAVRYAVEWEKFTDLFDKEHSLLPSDIVIADDTKILALWGIIGSNTSGVDENTKNITVEIGNFDSIVVRKTGVRLWLRTDAELRYEKFINPLYTLSCVEAMIDALKKEQIELGAYTFAGLTSHIAENDSIPLQSTIDIDWNWISRLIWGQDATEEFIADSTQTLERLGCVVRNGNEVTTPLWRSPDDITQQADIAEEIARVIGFDSIEEQAVIDEVSFVPFQTPVQWLRDTELLLTGSFNFTQIETYPWLDKKWIAAWWIATTHLHSLKNPLNPEQSILRDSMHWNLLDVLIKNAPFFDSLRCFDIGRVWNTQREGNNEHTMVWFALWNKETTKENHIHPLLEAKNLVAELLKTRGCKGKVTYKATEHIYAHPKQQAVITLNGKDIWSLLTVHPSLLEDHKLPALSECVLTQIDMTLAIQCLPKKRSLRVDYTSLQDQIITRDLSFLIDADVDYGVVTKALVACKEISHVRVFDLYQWGSVPEGKKSISVEITIPGDGTLQQEQINEIMKKWAEAAQKAWAILREA